MMRSGKDLVQLGRFARGITTSATSCSVPAVAPSGLFSFLGGKRVTTPLDTPFDGFEAITPVPVPSSPPPTEVTTLPNGVRVAAQETMGPYAALGIFVNSGSVNETPFTAGASHLLEQMAFKGTTTRTPFMMVRSAEAYGVMLSANVSREQSAFYALAPRNNVAAAMELLCDAVVDPKYQQHLLNDQIARVMEANKVNDSNPVSKMMEGVMSAAYSGALARPLYYTGASHIDAELLSQFHQENFTGGRMVVAAAGVPLSVAQSLAADYMAGVPGTAASPQPESVYVGGDYSDNFAGGAHALVAFETDGWNNIDGSVMATVSQYLLGGGQDFSSGGPGKGMYSRLYRNVLTCNHWVTSCSAYANITDRTGILGVTASTSDPSRSVAIVDVVCGELESVARNVTTAEVDRAKRQALATVHHALEMPQIVCEDIGRQILTLGERVHLSKYTSAINAVTADGVQSYFKAMLKTKPTGVLLGDQSVMPKFDSVKARFG